MSIVPIVIIAVIIVALLVVLVVQGMRASKLTDELEKAEQSAQTLATAKQSLHAQLQAAQQEQQQRVVLLQQQLTALDAENKKKTGWLEGQEEELTWLKAELEKRPKLDRKIYRILTLGMKATGKSSLTLKWSNPLTDLGSIEGTKIERYERTVSQIKNKDTLIEHVFEVHDWGGEHIVDAHQELVTEEIHGLLIVVDLGGRDARQVEMNRVTEQLTEFSPKVLQYFFGPKTVASCKSVVLFINKSDLVPGTPKQAEDYAKQLYQPLIDSLMSFSTQIDVKVFVGSASFGHSTHNLFSYFVEQILPKSAYDYQLLQRMKAAMDARPPARERLPTLTPQPGSNMMPVMPAPQIPHAQQQPQTMPSNGAAHPPGYPPLPSPPAHPGVAPQYGAPGPRPMAGRGTVQVPTLGSHPQGNGAHPGSSLETTSPLLNRPPLPPRRGV